MADATKLLQLNIAQWSRPGAERPRLDAPVSASATTLTFNYPLKDESGAVITGSTLIGVQDKDGYTESIWIPAAGVSADGLTATGCVRGVDLSGLDYSTANDATLAVKHEADDPVICQISAVYVQMIVQAIMGGISTGANDIKVGNLAAADIKFTFSNDQADKPYVYYDESGKRIRFHIGSDALGGINNEWEGVIPIGTTAQLASMSDLPTLGMVAADTTLGEMVFREGGAWVQKTGGGSVANGSTTVAGKWEEATVAEQGTATATGGTGARLVPAVANLVKTSSGAGDENKIAILGVGGKFASGFLPGNLSEADTFFGATDMTGAEAETLTGGGDAGASHYHLIKIGSGTLNITGNGANNIAHGLGRTPKMVTFNYATTTGATDVGDWSMGTILYDGTTTAALTEWGVLVSTLNHSVSTGAVQVYVNGTKQFDMTLTVTSTNIVITVANYAASEDVAYTFRVE